MCEWVSDALKSYLSASGKLNVNGVDTAVGQAARALLTPAAPTATGDAGNAAKLINKLSSAGQLKAGFLLRVLQQGQFDLFDLAFAKLLELPVPDFRRTFYLAGPRSVALACRAVGIDKSVFPTVFNLSRAPLGKPPVLTPSERADVECAFTTFSRSEAKSRLQTRISA